MFCAQCGKPFFDEARLCSSCGAPVGAPTEPAGSFAPVLSAKASDGEASAQAASGTGSAPPSLIERVKNLLLHPTAR